MNLPEGYIRLSYIESTGTQYIDTGFKPNNNTRVVMDAQMITLAQPNFFFGVRTSSNTVNYSVLLTGSKYRSDYGESKVSSSTAGGTDRVTIDKNKNVCTVSSETITNTSSIFQSAYNLYLFASNDGGTAYYFGSMKLYSCQIYDNGTLIRDYVPCKNESGVAGLYDTVNSAFYTTSVGAFTAGAELTPDYKMVDANQLDRALGATADAIRAKSGETAQIAWDAENGFASAVSAINGGKVVYGSFTMASGNNTCPVSITGVGFQPSHVLAYGARSGSQTNALLMIEGGQRSYSTCFGSTGTTHNYQKYFSMTMDSDGFTINSSSSSYKTLTTATWYYIAIG